MPEPGTKPPSPTKTVGLVAAASSAVTLLLMWLILRPPADHHRTIIAILAVGAIVYGAVLVLALLVRLVEYRFTRRYNEAARSQHEHRQFVEKQLAALVTQQQNLDTVLASISTSICEIDDRTQKNCKHIKTVETQVGRCMAEIGIVGESIDELRGAFIEEGLPQDLRQPS